jgi:hypothetical protein
LNKVHIAYKENPRVETPLKALKKLPPPAFLYIGSTGKWPLEMASKYLFFKLMRRRLYSLLSLIGGLHFIIVSLSLISDAVNNKLCGIIS